MGAPMTDDEDLDLDFTKPAKTPRPRRPRSA
jgi:hypothetical protein